MTREEIIRRLESTGIIGRQITQASVSMYSRALPEDDFSVCEMMLSGISERMEADLVTLSVSVSGKDVKNAQIPVVKGDCCRYAVTLKQEDITEFLESEAECTVRLTDKYGRELVQSSSLIQFGTKKRAPVCNAHVSFRKEIDLRNDPVRVQIADIKVSSDQDTTVCIDVSDSGKQLWQENIIVSSSSEVSKEISVDASGLAGKDSSSYTITVRCEGKIIMTDSAVLTIINKIEEPPGPKISLSMNILGDVELPEFVDTHQMVDGSVRFGSLILVNKDKEEHQVMVSVTLDGKDILCSRECVDDDLTLSLEAPFSVLARDSTYSCELITHVTDCDGSVVMHKISTLKVRSKYDLDLMVMTERVAQFVNPMNATIKELVDDSDGPLSKAMNGSFSVMGYQHEGKHVYKQAEAVYRMMYDVGMRYVSDVCTMDSRTTKYQCVRSPDKVFSDRSGNCLELSIFYASMIEAMGMEPVILFPAGHAVTGVVLATDKYKSLADVSGGEMDDCPVIEMDFGDRKAFVLVIESTMCPFCRDLKEAARTGYDLVEKNLTYIIGRKKYCFVKEMRLNGIEPMIGL